MPAGCSTFALVPVPASSSVSESASDFYKWQGEMLEMPVARKKIQFTIRSNDPALGQVGYNDTR